MSTKTILYLWLCSINHMTVDSRFTNQRVTQSLHHEGWRLLRFYNRRGRVKLFFPKKHTMYFKNVLSRKSLRASLTRLSELARVTSTYLAVIYDCMLILNSIMCHSVFITYACIGVSFWLIVTFIMDLYSPIVD